MPKRSRKAPTYLWRNRHGTYYFRAVIPASSAHLRGRFRREIRRSLGTDSWREAIIRARPWRVALDRVLGEQADQEQISIQRTRLEESPSNTDDSMSLRLDYLTCIEISPRGTRREFRADYGDPAKDLVAIREIRSMLDGSAEQQSSDASTAVAAPRKLTVLVPRYLQHLTERQQIDTKTRQQYDHSIQLVVALLGDREIETITSEDAESCTARLRRVPSNARKRYPGRSVEQLIGMENVDRISPATVNQHLSRASAFFSWAVKKRLTDHNPFAGEQIREARADHEQRDRFSNDELRALFRAVAEIADEPFKFWLPLLALYTGARQNELAQLRVSDITLDLKQPFLEIQKLPGEDDKKLKTAAARRTIPIHNDLLEIGFGRFIEDLQRRDTTRVFPELKHGKNGFGDAVSKWFNRTLLNHTDLSRADRRKCFHSFRHTFIDELKQAELPKELIAELAGHKVESITMGRYAKPHSLSTTAKAIQKLSFQLPIAQLGEALGADFACN